MTMVDGDDEVESGAQAMRLPSLLRAVIGNDVEEGLTEGEDGRIKGDDDGGGGDGDREAENCLPDGGMVGSATTGSGAGAARRT